jgi:VanZ family protein
MHTKRISDNSPSFFKAYWAALIWAAFILLLIGLPGKDLPNIDFWAINIEDKIAHMIVFGILTFLVVWGRWRIAENLSRRALIYIALLGIFYGGLTEFLQGVAFPSRFASLSDFLADGIGSCLGTVFASLWFNKLRRQNS